mgnify:CR=1 FL=1
MRLELEHFTIDGAYGWNQDWFPGWFMRMGGCAAVTACDSLIYFALRFGRNDLIPFDPADLTRRNYLPLSEKVKPFLHPRMRGIDRLEIYQDGLARYFRNIGVSGPRVDALHGEAPFADAADALRPGTNFFNAGTAWTNSWRHRWERLPDLGAAQEGNE